MSLNTDRTGIEDWRNVCFVYATAEDFDEGQSLEEIVNPPDRFEVNEDGSTERYIDCSPTPWGYVGEDRARIFKLSAVTFCIEFSCMSIGMGEITKKNWKEFWTRLNMLETANGPFLQVNRFITPDEVRAHIGLTANVIGVSKAKFKGTVARILRENAERRLYGSLKEEA